ncbi:hypothetical protein RND71_005123 [Anisodus tanguticus]|uniref:Uncharacterized protein n=1 Tax=Anisodus tanguticus TaxID=243964 RepID=A0AAE1SRI8_9SOLA|nr:hypothetical protein RND71_005123 [Anisodus tanguticus]
MFFSLVDAHLINLSDVDVLTQPEEEVLNCNMLDTEDVLAYENQDEEAVAMAEVSPTVIEMTTDHPASLWNFKSDGEASKSIDSSTNMNSATALRVRTIQISSPVLAAKTILQWHERVRAAACLLYKYMPRILDAVVLSELQFKCVYYISLVSFYQARKLLEFLSFFAEEAAFMDLLSFNTLSTITPTALLDVLMAADKFEVASCMRHSSRLLHNLPMTCESALLYLDLPSSVLIADAVLPLTDAAKQFLAARFKDITKFQEEVLNLPLAGIEAVLSNDDLQKMLKLKKFLTCNDFDPELASKVVLDALFFKAEAPYRQRSLAAEEGNSSHHRFVERAYKYRPVKVVEFELPHQQCIVYLDLKREECNNLFPSGRVYSQAFHLGGQGFFLSAHCNMDQQSSFHCFGLFLGMQEKESVSKPTEEYVSKYKGNYTFTGGKAVGYRNLFGVPWTTFMAEDSLYFINGILHLRAELTIRQ